MYRFLLRPKWIGFHLLVLAAIVTMVNLGFWQLRRLDERQAFNATIEERYDAPAVELDVLVGAGRSDPNDPGLADVEWRPVRLTGTYLADESILIVNRSQGGRAGQNVVTPLTLGDGRVLLVNRGFVALGADVPAAPSGAVEVAGRVRRTQERRTGQLSDSSEGALIEAQRIDLERIAPQIDGALVPMYVELTTSDPPEPATYPEPVQAPELGEGPHLGYAVQWYIFAIAVAVGWVLAVRRSVRTRRDAASREDDDHDERAPALTSGRPSTPS